MFVPRALFHRKAHCKHHCTSVTRTLLIRSFHTLAPQPFANPGMRGLWHARHDCFDTRVIPPAFTCRMPKLDCARQRLERLFYEAQLVLKLGHALVRRFRSILCLRELCAGTRAVSSGERVHLLVCIEPLENVAVDDG